MLFNENILKRTNWNSQFHRWQHERGVHVSPDHPILSRHGQHLHEKGTQESLEGRQRRRDSEQTRVHQPLACVIAVDVCKGNTAGVASEVFEVLTATRKLIRVQEWSTDARARILWRKSWIDNREGRSKHREATVRIRESGGDQELHARGGTKGKFSYLPACVPRNAGNDEADAGGSARTWRTVGEGSIKRKALSYLVVIPMSVVVGIAARTTFFGKFYNNARGTRWSVGYTV